MFSTRRHIVEVLLWALAASVPGGAADVSELYRHLAAFTTVSAEPTAETLRLAAGGVATLEMSGGRLALAAPLVDGRVPGLVFEGGGMLRLSIRDPFEQAQLARFSGREGGPVLELPFVRAVVRTSQRWAELEAAVPEGAGAVANALLGERLETWLRDGRLDVDARTAAGLATPGDTYLWAEVETVDFGWLCLEHDPWQAEPVVLARLERGVDWVEEWVRLPGPGAAATTPVRLDLERVEVSVDLTDHDAREWTSTGAVEGQEAGFRAVVRLVPRVTGPTAVQLALDRSARVSAVGTAAGQALPWVRAEVGRRFATVDRDLSDRALVVGLPEPLTAGEPVELVVDYRMKIYNFATGGDWYPVPPDTWDDPHHAQISFRHRRPVEVRAVGRRTESRTEGDVVLETWATERPTKMAGFAFGKGYKEECVTLDGIPEICVFGRESGITTGNMVRNVAADVANSLAFYRWLLDTPIPGERLVVSRISGAHGQAFEGFIHLSSFTFDSESPGASELFRAHEAAHQYWGHMVGWRSYRDQWLSEALAEYSAMLFVDATLQGKGYFQEIVDSYIAEQTGSMGMVMSKFARPWMLGDLRSADRRAQLGPVAAGYRAGTATVPYGYMVQVYDRGALVVHMIRSLLRAKTGNDDLFIAVLRDFVRTWSGRSPGTRDLQATLARIAPGGGDWGWFFDQWVYGAAVPTYAWSCELPRRAEPDGRWVVKVTVEQRDVPEGFVMPVPMRVETTEGVSQVLIPVRNAEETFAIPLSAKPRKVELNPGGGVLAKMRKR